MMNLPEELEQQFQIELQDFEEARKMKYVTSIERMARQDERAVTQTEIALNMLKRNMPLETIAEITGLTIEQLQQLQADS
jgi:hypothetical protein